MSDNSVFISGAATGSFVEALDGLPPWATEETAKRIESTLRKSLGIQTKGFSDLAKCCANKGMSAADLKKANDQLADLVKNYNDENDTFPAKRKHWREEETEAQKQKKRWAEAKAAHGGWMATLGTLTAWGISIRGVLLENKDTFDLLYRSGINVVSGLNGANTGFEALQQMASLTGVRYTELAKTIVKYSDAINAYGTGKFIKTMAGASVELRRFGFDTKEAGELLGTYLESQRGFTDINSRNQAEVQGDLVKFGERITRVSTATGMMRSKILENLEALSQSAEATILSGQVGSTAAENTLEFIASFKDKNIGQAFLRMMTDAIKPLNTTFMDFQKIGFGGFGQKLMNFTKTLEGLPAEEQQKRVAEFMAANKAEADVIVQRANLLKQAGVKEGEGAIAMIAGLQQQARAYKEVSEEDRKKLELTSKATKDLAAAWERLKAQLQITFGNLPEILDKFTAGLEWVNEFFATLRGFDKVGAAPWVAAGLAILGTIASFKLLTKSIDWLAGKIFNMGRGGGGRGGGGRGGGGGGGRGGGASGGAMSGIARGLAAFANPQVLVGAGILAASVAVIGAGIAGATWILGAALPKFAEGVKAFSDIDGKNLLSVATGIAALGGSIAVFGGAGIVASFGSVLSTITGGLAKLFGDGSVLDQISAFAKLGPGLQIVTSTISNLSTNLSVLSGTLKSFTGLDVLKDIVSTINGLNVIKAIALGGITKINTASLPSPSSPVGVSTPSSPRASVLTGSTLQPGITPPSVPVAASPTQAGASGTETPVKDSSINTLIGYQNALLEQLLSSNNGILSTNKDILKYTKVRT